MTEILSSWRDQPSSCGECDSFVYDLSGQEETSVDSPPDRETIDPIPTRMAEEDCRTASVQKIITDEQRVREFYTLFKQQQDGNGLVCGEVSDLARNLLKGTKYEIASRRIMFPEVVYPSPDTQESKKNVLMGALPLLTFAEGRRKVDSMEIEKFTRCKYVKVRSRAYAFIYIDVDTAAVVPSAEYEKRYLLHLSVIRAGKTKTHQNWTAVEENQCDNEMNINGDNVPLTSDHFSTNTAIMKKSSNIPKSDAITDENLDPDSTTQSTEKILVISRSDERSRSRERINKPVDLMLRSLSRTFVPSSSSLPLLSNHNGVESTSDSRSRQASPSECHPRSVTPQSHSAPVQKQTTSTVRSSSSAILTTSASSDSCLLRPRQSSRSPSPFSSGLSQSTVPSSEQFANRPINPCPRPPLSQAPSNPFARRPSHARSRTLSASSSFVPSSNTNNTDINDMTPDSAVRMVPTYGSESWSGFMQREERMVSTSQSHSHSPYLSGLISSLEDSIDSGDTASATYLNDCNRRNVGEKNLGGVAFNPKKIIDVEGRHRAKTDSAVRTNFSNGKILRVLGLNRVENGVEERGPITQGRTLDLCPSQIPSQGVLSRSRSADKSVTWCQEGESVSKNIGTRSASAGREIHESQSFLPINAMKSDPVLSSTRSHNDIPKESNARSISLPSYNWKDVSQFDSSSPHSVTGLLPYDEIPVSTGESSTYDTGHPETDVDFLAVKYTSTPPDCDVRTADCDVSTDLVSELQLRYSSVVADDIRGVWLWENDVRILNGSCQVETDILNTETISSLQIAPLTILLTDNDMNEFSSLKCNASVRSDSEIERGRETGVSRWKGRWRNVSSSALKISKFFNKKG